MLKAELQEAYDALLVEVEGYRKGDDGLRDSIIHIAGQAAAEHELCGVLEKTLAKIGIAVPQVEVVIAREVKETYRVPLIDAYRMEVFKDGKVRDDLATYITKPGTEWSWDSGDFLQETFADDVSALPPSSVTATVLPVA